MYKVIYSPFNPSGVVTAPPSKSDVHRAIICAALSKGKCTISPITLSDDIKATISCIKSLGATVYISGDAITVNGCDIFKNNSAVFNCGESGSTLRFFVPIAALGGIRSKFIGHGSLLSRPIGLFSDILPSKGVTCETTGTLPLKTNGKLKGGLFEIPGNVSSQFITGLLIALPLLDHDSDIVLTSPVESIGYINMTIHTMSAFGVYVKKTDYGWHIPGCQNYSPTDYTTDGDWSQASFFMIAGAIGGNVTVQGVQNASEQGDKSIVEILKKFGAKIDQTASGINVREGKLRAITIDASQIPDLVPALSVCASFAEGTTIITNAERLRIKECDRLRATAELINCLGGKAVELPNGLEITGIKKFSGNCVKGFNDHRIVMSAAICASKLDGKIECSDAMSINKSYPNFYVDYKCIGGNANVISLR